MKQEVELIIRITAQVDADQTREQLLKTANNQIAMLQGLIQKPVTLMALREEAEIYGNDETKPPVIITVQGGNVQDVENIPPGVTIEIHDFDNSEDGNTADVASYTSPPRYPLGHIQWKAQGDANEYTILRGDDWLAAVKLHGALMGDQQSRVMDTLVDTLMRSGVPA